MRPRAGVDAHFLARPEGNRTYVLSLLRALARSRAHERFEIAAYCFDPARDALLLGADAAAFRWERLPRSGPVRYLAVPKLQRRDGLALWHATFVAPSGPAQLALAVHDALALAQPSLLPLATRLKLGRLLAPSIRRARAVLVPSDAVKRELDARGLGERARVAPIGIDRDVFHPGGAPRDFLLAVGRADKRKRLSLLLRAFEKLPRGRLVLAGPLEPRRWQRPNVAVVPSPGEGELADLYRGARALVFPSAGEGLGLPVVEALACGTPVVASDIPSVREVAGEAALALVPPDEEALAAAMTRALDLPAAERERLARAGLRRVEGFTLEAMAEATERAWNEALG